MTPIVDNERLYFEASGLYDGLVLLGDTKTRSYWNHITGECLHGHYKGKNLDIHNLLHYTFKAALKEFPDLKIAISKPPFPYNLVSNKVSNMMIKKKHFIPPFFRTTMTNKDDRLDESELGLGVIINGSSKFYKVDDIMDVGVLEDAFSDKILILTFDENSRIPRCVIKDSHELPIQLYTRWYGFSYTYKNCEIYKER